MTNHPPHPPPPRRSYKGSHLALMVELLAGALPGAAMQDKRTSNDWGSLIIAIDPEEFDSLESFQARVRVMCHRVKQAKRVAGCDQIFLPGERGDLLDAENRRRGSLEVPEVVFAKLREMQAGAGAGAAPEDTDGAVAKKQTARL
jgi:LDH2 family malate/lactate/ureidoglycolate dehydrogenase